MSDKLVSRDGPLIGRANERRLVQKAGGEDAISKAYQTNLDGTKTMAHTRGELSRPEVITTDPEPAKPLVDDGEWTYDYNPLRSAGGGLVPDLEGALPRNDPAKGAKTRRGGLKITSETECMLSVSKSSYDIHDKDKHRKMVRGPNYWYDKRNVVTWASEIEVDEASDGTDYPFTNRVGVVQYEDATGLHEITIISQQPLAAYNGGIAILCACMAKSADGRRYLRVAFINSGMLYVRDFRKGVLIATASWRHVGLTPHTGPVVDGLQIDGIHIGRNLAGFSQDGLRLVTAFDPDSLATAWRGNQCLVLTIPPPGESLSITPSIHAFSVPVVSSDVTPLTVTGSLAVPSFDDRPITGFATGFQEITRTNQETGAVETFEPNLTPREEYYDYDVSQETTGVTSRYQTSCSIQALGFSKDGDVCGVVTAFDRMTGSTLSEAKEYHYHKWWSSMTSLSYSWYESIPNDDYTSFGSGPTSRRREDIGSETSSEHTYDHRSSKTYYCSSASAVHLGEIDAEYNFDKTISYAVSSSRSENTSISYADNYPFKVETTFSGSGFSSNSDSTRTITVTVTEEGLYSGATSVSYVSAADFRAGVVAIASRPFRYHPGYERVITKHNATVVSDVYIPSDVPMVDGDDPYNPPGSPDLVPDLEIGHGETTVSIIRGGVTVAEKTGPMYVGYGDWWERKKAYFSFSHAFDDTYGSFGGLLYKAGNWYNLVRNPNEPAGEFPHVPPNISHY